jgi:hypothetical protein
VKPYRKQTNPTIYFSHGWGHITAITTLDQAGPPVKGATLLLPLCYVTTQRSSWAEQGPLRLGKPGRGWVHTIYFLKLGCIIGGHNQQTAKMKQKSNGLQLKETAWANQLCAPTQGLLPTSGSTYGHFGRPAHLCEIQISDPYMNDIVDQSCFLSNRNQPS